MKTTLATLASRLRDIRADFTAAESRKKRALITQARRLPLDDASAIRSYHESLLFLVAYPDNRSLARLVVSELKRISTAVASDPSLARSLKNSGIHASLTTCCYSLDLLAWLSAHHPRDAALIWRDDSVGEKFDEILPRLIPRSARDGLLTDRLSTREWLRLAGCRNDADVLRWIVTRVSALPAEGPERDAIFDSLELQCAWRLRGAQSSRTLMRVPGAKRYFHSDGVLKRFLLIDAIAKPLPRARRLKRAAADRLLDVCRGSLAVRQRETDAATFPNPAEVFFWNLDRGFSVVLYGMAADRRLPIESFFGFLLAKNGVPLAYGGGWVFCDRCEIGVNVFDTFRGGESAFGFAQVMRVYRHFFRSRRFTVDPFQFGEDNPEAIRSGAFWFYYRMGFRPIEPKWAALAAEEWDRLSRSRSYRSPPGVLRRLAQSQIAIDLPGTKPAIAQPDLTNIGLAVTRWIGRFGSIEAARSAKDRTLADALGHAHLHRWTYDQCKAFDELGYLAAMIPDLRDWSRREKADLAKVLCAKAGRMESDYVRKLQQHDRFRAALARIAAEGSRIGPKK